MSTILSKLRIGPLTATALLIAALVLSTLSSRAGPEATQVVPVAPHVFVPTSVEIAGSDAEPAPTF